MEKKMNARKKAQRAARLRKQRNRRIALTLCLMFVVAFASIGGTIAWLTAESGEVTNTFTVGDINIKLDEAVLGSTTGERTTTGNEGYKIYPGAVIAKDPTVTVLVDSEPCYVYVSVDNQIKLTDAAAPVATLNIGENWSAVSTSGTKTIYAYTTDTGETKNPTVVNALNAEVKLPAVFTNVTIDTESVTKANIQQLKDKTIVVQAYAHQSNATTVAAANAAAIAALAD